MEKKEKILEGAMKEFLVQGYAGTSMDRVAKAAAVSKTTVYSHFGDKEGLFVALVERLAKKKYSEVFSQGNHSLLQGEPEVVLRQFATKMVDLACEDTEDLTFIRLIVGESGRFPKLAETFVSNLVKPGIEVLSQYLASRPELEIEDREATARVILGSLVYFKIVQVMLYGEKIVPMEGDRLINSLLHLLLR